MADDYILAVRAKHSAAVGSVATSPTNSTVCADDSMVSLTDHRNTYLKKISLKL